MFLILGRPRSRTAWAANLLTVPPVSRCLHEAMADGGSLARLRERLEAFPDRAAGTADTGLIHHLDAVLSAFPDARLVLLTGDGASWRRWCSRNQVPREVRSQIEGDYARAERRLRGRALFMDPRDLTTSADAAEALWDHCVPGEPFDRARWATLKDLNIQVIPEALLRRLRRSGGLQTALGL